VKFKKLAGGGYFKIVNQSVDAALHKLGYSQEQIEAIERTPKARALWKKRHILTALRSRQKGSTRMPIAARRGGACERLRAAVRLQ